LYYIILQYYRIISCHVILYYSFLETPFRADVPNPDSAEDMTYENHNSFKVNPRPGILIAVIQSCK